MGGYFNEFRRTAVTASLVVQLREAVAQCLSTAGEDVQSIVKNANTFLRWYGDKQTNYYVVLRTRRVKKAPRAKLIGFYNKKTTVVHVTVTQKLNTGHVKRFHNIVSLIFDPRDLWTVP